MEIYIADVRALAAEQVFFEKISQIPKERRERLLQYRNASDRQRSLGAGLLLEYGLHRYGYSLLADAPGITQVQLEYGVHGKAYLPPQTGIFFNLSHAGEAVAAVFSDTEVGIDVERVRTPHEALVKRIFGAKEQAVLFGEELPAWMPQIAKEERQSCTDLIFTGMWTRKESYVKAVGDGICLPLAEFNVLGERVSGDADYALRTWRTAGECFLSVCAKGDIDAEPAEIVIV